MPNGGLTTTQKRIYGSGRFGTSLLFNLVTFLTFYLYFEIFNLNPILNGIATGLGKFAIAFSSFYFGILSDKTITRWGKRRPYILIGAPMLGLSFIFLYLPHIFGLNVVKIFGISFGNDVPLFIYLLTFFSVFNFAYGLLLSPYQSWMAEITSESERFQVSTYLNTANIIGAVISAFITFFFPIAFRGEALPLIPYVVIILGTIETCGFILPFTKIKEDPNKLVPIKHDIIAELKSITKNNNYMWWQMSNGLFFLAQAIVLNNLLGFISEVLKFGTIQYIIGAAVLFLVVMIFWQIWTKVSKKYSKHYALQSAMIVMGMCTPFSLLLGLFPSEAFGYLYVALVASGVSSMYLFPYINLADFADDDNLKTGKQRAGLYYGVKELILNFFESGAMFITGILFGFLPFLPILKTLTETNIETFIILLVNQTLPQPGQNLLALLFLLGEISLEFPNPVSTGYLWFGPVSALIIVFGLLVFNPKVKIDFNIEKRREEIKKGKL